MSELSRELREKHKQHGTNCCVHCCIIDLEGMCRFHKNFPCDSLRSAFEVETLENALDLARSACAYKNDRIVEMNAEIVSYRNLHWDARAALRETPCSRSDFPGDTCAFWHEKYGQKRCLRCAFLTEHPQ